MGGFLALLEVLGPLVGRALDAYNKARALAAQAGVTEADLAAADARFLRHYDDPLAGETPTPEPSNLYGRPVEAEPKVPPYASGDHVYKRTDGRWFVSRASDPVVGFPGATYQGDLP